jgi:hypothetical protein
MDYNLLLEKLKNDNYPELKETDIELKSTKILGKTFMITLPFSKNIFYNEKIIKKCNTKALNAVLLHELYHIIQFKRLNFLQKLIFLPRYHLYNKFRKQHEIEAHTEVVKRGFGEDLIELNKFVKERYPSNLWEKKISNYYLTEKEIKQIMH